MNHAQICSNTFIENKHIEEKEDRNERTNQLQLACSYAGNFSVNHVKPAMSLAQTFQEDKINPKLALEANKS